MYFLESYLTCFCWQDRWFGALDQAWITQSSSRQCLSRNGCSQTQLKASVMGHSVLFLFSNTDTTSTPACPYVWKEKASPFHCIYRCWTGVLVLPRGLNCPHHLQEGWDPEFSPGLHKPNELCGKQSWCQKWVGRAQGRQGFGTAVCQGQVEKSCVQQNQLLCLLNAAAQ